MITIHFETAGGLIRHYRKDKGLNQKELGKLAKMGNVALSEIETGKRHANYEDIVKIFNALGLGNVYLTVVDKTDDLLERSKW